MNFNEFIWYQLSNLTGCDEVLEHFYNHYPDKPGKAHWCEQLAYLKNMEFLLWIVSD